MKKEVIRKKVFIVRELERIRQTHGNVLQAEDVVNVAQSARNPLHGYFTWDDTKAAHEYRLWQARKLIEVAVTILPNCNKPIQAYVSLRSSRSEDGGGYLSLVEVLRSPDLRKQLLRESLDDLRTWEERYHRLSELAPIFKARRDVARRVLVRTG